MLDCKDINICQKNIHSVIIYKATLLLSCIQRTVCWFKRCSHSTSPAALLQIFGRYGSQGAGRQEEGRKGDGSKRGRQAGWH